MRKLLAALLALTVPAPLLAGRPAAAATVWHVVAPGETMASIARDFGLNTAALGRWNQIVAPYPVHIDATLRLNPPAAPLPAWRTRIEPVTPGMVNWKPIVGCPVPPSELRRVWVSYIDLRGAYHDGSIIVRRDVAARVQTIFLTLFRWRYRIMAMAPMSVNMPGETDMGIVTAGYNCRPIAGTRVWSEHAYGTAIDINPLQNPMTRVGSRDGGSPYLDRSRHLIGMIHPDGAARAFTENGYFWGGQWHTLKDYMHFSVTNR
ncbi:M15 family metallopeptidase [Actinoplanes sp. KI2]|uniref:M15 family metallopeptidase n=1 Tax=Actinoplanes sp. KI2 TaxID=2983315 RepID=UPI0021D60F8E|nr:M15 family metallopeptidase [Actinoplanes sp. KI2]MCU7726148.1 M15 family metallopeptidase [Actinoplanes sp. KI2]